MTTAFFKLLLEGSSIFVILLNGFSRIGVLSNLSLRLFQLVLKFIQITLRRPKRIKMMLSFGWISFYCIDRPCKF